MGRLENTKLRLMNLALPQHLLIRLTSALAWAALTSLSLSAWLLACFSISALAPAIASA
eukprot:CAMPEP_0172616866 /NCGR_PEP_ID=MMETSP1068-20121228/68396_1 /TAXON_ID=35684 /ORGANISM="Pseudopedinella elastica, Strain CCMP716" /LENGTH=58 /DNA_ID=CAMNT_0013422463 /DNA_START=12 /DNA_END=185 /DNA_ORIENTATION=+